MAKKTSENWLGQPILKAGEEARLGESEQANSAGKNDGVRARKGPMGGWALVGTWEKESENGTRGTSGVDKRPRTEGCGSDAAGSVASGVHQNRRKPKLDDDTDRIEVQMEQWAKSRRAMARSPTALCNRSTAHNQLVVYLPASSDQTWPPSRLNLIHEISRLSDAHFAVITAHTHRQVEKAQADTLVAKCFLTFTSLTLLSDGVCVRLTQSALESSVESVWARSN